MLDLYIILNEERIKIGRSKNPKTRINQISTSSGIPLSKLYMKVYQGKGELESLIKNILEKEKITGEWFYLKGIARDFYHFVIKKETIDEYDIKHFLYEFYKKIDDKNNIELEKTLKKIDKNINSPFMKKYYDGNSFSYDYETSINTISKEQYKTVINSDHIDLFDDSMFYFYKENQYIWRFPEREYQLVKKLLDKFSRNYR